MNEQQILAPIVVQISMPAHGIPDPTRSLNSDLPRASRVVPTFDQNLVAGVSVTDGRTPHPKGGGFVLERLVVRDDT